MDLKFLLTPAAEKGTTKEEVYLVLDELFKCLTPEQYKVMYTKYRSSDKVLANWEVAKRLKKNRWDVWKIHRRAMKRMRERLGVT